jgi:hypothetical protein
VTVTAEEGKTRIDLITQEWDFQVKEFAAGREQPVTVHIDGTV